MEGCGRSRGTSKVLKEVVERKWKLEHSIEVLGRSRGASKVQYEEVPARAHHGGGRDVLIPFPLEVLRCL